MSALRVGFIGTGPKPEKPGATGYGMAHEHASAYQALPPGEVELVACCDLVRERAETFAERYTIPLSGVYTDYHQMLGRERLDLVSICTWPDAHAPLVIGATAYKPKGIFCEKPMADTWGAAKRMHQAAADAGVRLGFNHQRRFGLPFRKARQLIDEGKIGTVRRVEFGFGNLCDYGSHSFDLSAYFASDTRAKWVFAQIDYREENLVFGQHQENSALVEWEYHNGVLGLGATGRGKALVNCHNRVVGTEGEIEVGSAAPEHREQVLRWRPTGQREWSAVDTGKENCHGPGYIERAVAEFVSATRAGRESELSSSRVLGGTEIFFAAWHSSRVRGVVDLPLTADDNALAAMVESGELRPKKTP